MKTIPLEDLLTATWGPVGSPERDLMEKYAAEGKSFEEFEDALKIIREDKA